MWVLFRETDWEIELNQCPHAVITEDSGRAFRLYALYQKGRFPLTCEVLDLPKKLVDAFSLIDQYMDDLKVDPGA